MKPMLYSLMLLAVLLLSACKDVIPPDTDTHTDKVTETEEIIEYPDQIIPDTRETVYRLLSKETFAGGQVSSSLRFGYDDEGRLIYVREDGKTTPYLTVAYGENGEVSEIVDASRMKNVKRSFENGDLVFMGGYVGGTLIESREYVYDDGGRLISDTEYSEEGSVIEKYEYEYDLDENGNATAKYAAYTNKYTPMERYEYDGGGNLVKTEYYYGRVTPETVVCNEYDETGKMAFYKYYSSREGEDGPELYLSFLIEYEYTDDGEIKTERHYNSGETGDMVSHMTKEYEYENGLLISVSEMYSHDELPDTVETFEYDENGNLITYKYAYYEGGNVAYEKNIAYTYREFMLTEEEVSANGVNDAVIEEYVQEYKPY